MRKNQRDGDCKGRKPVANRTIYKSRKQSDRGKNDHRSVKLRHLSSDYLTVEQANLAQYAEQKLPNPTGRSVQLAC